MSDTDGRKLLAAALGRVPSGVFILSARHGEQETGMLVSWVQQCSFDPPQVSLALKPDREVTAWLTPGAAYTLNVLGHGQGELVSHFGKGFAPGEPAFAGLAVERPNGGAPVLRDALAYLECQVVAKYPGGDHDLYVGRVVGGQLLGEGRPWVHIRKSGSHY